MKVSVEMGLKGWEEQRSVASEEECRGVWKKKGDVGEWMFLLENVDGEDLMRCVMSLKAGKELAAKMTVSRDLMMLTDVEVLLVSMHGAVVRLLKKELGGGYVCQDL